MKVCIVSGKVKKKLFKPADDFEIWGFNCMGLGRSWIKRWDRLFNVHDFNLLEAYGYETANDKGWSAVLPDVPYYVAENWPARYLVGQRHFPREELAKLGSRGNYHCGSIDWLVAFAIYLGAKEILLHGVGLCLEAGEPISARACLEYWCGYAEGQGCKVTAAPDCDIFHFYHLVKSDLVYGYDDTPIFEDRTGKKPPKFKKAPYDYKE